MIPLNRYTIVALAALFSVYHTVRGVLTLDRADSPWPSVVAIVVYLVATGCALWPVSPTKVPLWVGVVGLVASIAVPLLVTSQLDPAVNNGYATWHVASVGTLLTILAVRGHALLAWVGVGFLLIQTIVWGGPIVSVEVGVTGSVMWVAVANVLTRSLARLAKDADQLADAERRAAQWQASQHAHENERRIRLAQTSRLAQPMLRKIVLEGGELGEAERSEARVLEASLRDEIRGRELLNDDVRASVLAARRRGATVSLLDEGTIDDLDQADRDRVLGTVAQSIAESTAERLIVRTAPADGAVAVTVVGLTPSTDAAEPGDTVTLWLEIPRSVGR
ncbi:hypothetical protein GCM10027416_06440 [Okibacterium endophyticum]